MNKDKQTNHKFAYWSNNNIVAKDYGVIYYATQKNANTTIKAQFVEVLGMTKSLDYPKDIHRTVIYPYPRSSQQEVMTEFQDFLKFAVIRNPWDRLVSCYKNKIQQDNTTAPNHILQCSPQLYIGMSFEEFVNVICTIPDHKADYHFCSQTYLMYYPDGFFPINYLCDFENLQFHLNEIKDLTGIPFSPLNKFNSTKSSSYESFYTSELVEKVRKRYELEIDFFKYQFVKKNKDFTFGIINDTLKKQFTNSSLASSILNEKKQDLVHRVIAIKTPTSHKEKFISLISERIIVPIRQKFKF